MLRRRAAAAIVLAIALVMCVPARADVSGKWIFRHAGDRFQGAIILVQSGSAVTGTWHTEFGKSEADSVVSGRIDRDKLYLTRSMGSLEQRYVLTISTDGNRIDGFGEGWGISHANLNLRRDGWTVPPSADVSGEWMFRHVGKRFQGAITLKQSGPAVTGTWHTATGKSEPDSPVSGQVEGDRIYLTRSMGGLEQSYVLTISKDGNRIDGFGEGWGISHANLNLKRAPRGKRGGM